MNIENPYLPCDRQDIDNIPLEDEFISFNTHKIGLTKLDKPCGHHRIAFPSNDLTLYPEMRHIPCFKCNRCGWYVSCERKIAFAGGGTL